MKFTTSRRTFLRGTAATALAAPAIVSTRALASSGEVNILMWSDYLPDTFIDAFKAETGITINYTGIGSNEEIINKMKATRGRGFDIISPTNNRALQWKDLELLQPIHMSRVPIEAVNPAMAKIGETDWSLDGENIFWLPHIWGTEGIAWRTDLWQPAGEFPSYGDIWVGDATDGKTMGRPHSMMLGAGLYMERAGLMDPGSVWKAYTSEEEMRKTWGKITDFAIANKSHVKLLWNDADTQKNGLLNEGVIVGQTWDGPPLALKNAGDPIQYRAPMEGSMAWVDGMAIPIGAENFDEIYAFIEFAYKPAPAGEAIDHHGYNSPVLGADAFAGEAYARNFADAYPGDALANLNPWPSEPQWYADVRTEYRNRFVSA